MSDKNIYAALLSMKHLYQFLIYQFIYNEIIIDDAKFENMKFKNISRPNKGERKLNKNVNMSVFTIEIG